jgi:hypothetical protein
MGAWPMHDATSATIHDVSGRNHDGAQTGGVANLIGGTWGKCLDSSTDTDVEVPNSTDLSIGDSGTDHPFTLMLLMKVNSNGSFYQLLSKSNGGTREWEFFINSSGNVLQFLLFESSSDVTRIGRTSSSDPLSLGDWHTVFVTYDGSASASGIKQWVDGVQVDASDSNSGIYTGSGNKSVSIGIGHRASGAPLDGEIANTVLWNRELDPSSIRLLSHNPYLMYQEPDLMEWLGGTTGS